MNLKAIWSILIFTLLGCGRTTLPFFSDEGSSSTTRRSVFHEPDSGAVVEACLPQGSTCGIEAGITAACCEGTSCLDYTVDDYRRCLVESPPLCGAVNTSCAADADCCGDAFCDSWTSYISTECVAKLATGLFCTRDSQCQSDVCRDAHCVSATCREEGAHCTTNADCCSGFFCDNWSGYISTGCAAMREVGDYCEDDSHCLSGHCDDSRCAH